VFSGPRRPRNELYKILATSLFSVSLLKQTDREYGKSDHFPRLTIYLYTWAKLLCCDVAGIPGGSWRTAGP